MTDRKTVIDEETITVLEDERMELEQKLLQHYCTVGKRLLEEAAAEQREINQLVESLLETRRKLDLFCSVHCPYCYGLIERDSTFCKHCGKLQPEIPNIDLN